MDNDTELSKEQKAALDVLIDGGLSDFSRVLLIIYYNVKHMGYIFDDDLYTRMVQDYIDSKVAKE